MEDGNLNPMDSVLSYVAGKKTGKEDTLREREAGSWLLMATDLVPFSPNSLRPGGFDDHQGHSEFGWDATNPYEDSLLSNYTFNLPDSSADTADDLGSTDSLRLVGMDSFTLPSTAAFNEQKTNSVFPSSDYQLHIQPSLMGDSSVTQTAPLAPPSMSLRQQAEHSENIAQLSSTEKANLTKVNRKRPIVPAGLPNLNGSSPAEFSTPEFQAQEKRQKRLEKNREIAKNCRKRKKERKEELEREIALLREQNNRMRIQLRDDPDDNTRNAQREACLDRLRSSLSSGDKESALSNMQQYLSDWVDFGAKRLTMAEFHLDQLKTLVLPTQVTKMCMWAMQQGDEFFDERLNEVRYGGGIWNMIASVLQPSAEQVRAILRSRTGTVQQQQNVADVLEIVDKVQRCMEGSMSSMREQLEGIIKVLTPEQQVKFLLFTKKFLNEPRSKESIFHALRRDGKTQPDNESSLEEDEA